MIKKGDTLRFADNDINRTEMPYFIGIIAYCRDVSGDILHITCSRELDATVLSYHKSRFEKVYSRLYNDDDFCLNCLKMVEPVFVPTTTPPDERQEGYLACPHCRSDDSLTDDFNVVCELCTDLAAELYAIQAAKDKRRLRAEKAKQKTQTE